MTLPFFTYIGFTQYYHMTIFPFTQRFSLVSAKKRYYTLRGLATLCVGHALYWKRSRSISMELVKEDQ
jgi:hypothetical protein